MDFYETARFQYAVARLSVKLDQFRRTGRFSQRVTTSTRTNIDLFPFDPGSFNVRIEAEPVDGEVHVDVPLTALWTYVIERVFRPTDTQAALDLIDDNALRSEFFDLVEKNTFEADRAISLLRERIEGGAVPSSSESELLERLISEVERRAYLRSHSDLLRQISPQEDAKLVTMATPLLSELAVPLRRSAKLVTISTIDGRGRRPILTTDRRTASELEFVKIDTKITSLDVNIVQYNKETGWGKFRNANWEGLPSFNVPADRKDELRFDLLEAMRDNEVNVDAYIVRNAANEPTRLILIDVFSIDENRL
jgi:hypothetical protein